MAAHVICMGNTAQQWPEFLIHTLKFLALIWNVNTIVDRLSWFIWLSFGTYQYKDLKSWISF